MAWEHRFDRQAEGPPRDNHRPPRRRAVAEAARQEVVVLRWQRRVTTTLSHARDEAARALQAEAESENLDLASLREHVAQDGSSVFYKLTMTAFCRRRLP